MGMAIATIGPIKIDPSTRVTLEGVLAGGGTKFPITLYNDEKEEDTKESGTIMLTNESIRIIKH